MRTWNIRRLLRERWHLAFRGKPQPFPPLQDIQPPSIAIDASTACQLRCPVCPTAKGQIAKTLGTGLLTFSNSKQLVDDNPWVRDIELSGWGEIFLNHDLPAILQYAHQKQIALRADVGVNLNTASDAVLEALVQYQFRSLRCAIDGASQETYAIYPGEDISRRCSRIFARSTSSKPAMALLFRN